jgi:ribonuclease HII
MPTKRLIVGIDEVGRGCLAGPVVACAVILQKQVEGVRDSKKLTARRRAQLVPLIHAAASHHALGSASVEEIDTINILQATFLAMHRAVLALDLDPERVELLFDGNQIPGWSVDGGWSARALIGGDDIEPAIAAASILAKENRDGYMSDQDVVLPGYNFSKHKGYGTALHMAALQKLGVSVLHRRSFAPVTALLSS